MRYLIDEGNSAALIENMVSVAAPSSTSGKPAGKAGAVTKPTPSLPKLGSSTAATSREGATAINKSSPRALRRRESQSHRLAQAHTTSPPTGNDKVVKQLATALRNRKAPPSRVAILKPPSEPETPQQQTQRMIWPQIFSSHWHRERSKISFGVRGVITNGFTVCGKSRKKSDVADINLAYGALYGLGSDGINRFITFFWEEGARGPGHLYVFHEVCLTTILMNVWGLCQNSGRKDLCPQIKGAWGQAEFQATIDEIIEYILEEALSMQDTPIIPATGDSGCSSYECDLLGEQHDRENVLSMFRKRSEAAKAEINEMELKRKRKQVEEERKDEEKRRQ